MGACQHLKGAPSEMTLLLLAELSSERIWSKAAAPLRRSARLKSGPPVPPAVQVAGRTVAAQRRPDGPRPRRAGAAPRSTAERAAQLAAVAAAAYEMGGPAIHLPLDASHALIIVTRKARARSRRPSRWVSTRRAQRPAAMHAP